MKRIAFLLIIMLLAVPSTLAADSISGSVESQINAYIERFDMSDSCAVVISKYLPNLNNFEAIKQEGMNAYKVLMKNGLEYILVVADDGEPTCLMTADEDTNSQIKYYDKAQLDKSPYIGNRNTRKFHKAECSSVDDMKESNKVELHSVDEALEKGYVGCKRCKP